MYATNVRNLKKNPSLALRQAEKSQELGIDIVRADETTDSEAADLSQWLAS